MNCTEAKEKIELYVLGGLSAFEENRLRTHLAVCPDCGAIEAQYRTIAGELKYSGVSELPGPDFINDLLISAKSEIAKTKHKLFYRGIIRVASIAACLAIGIAIWQFSKVSRPVKPAGPGYAAISDISLDHIQAGVQLIAGAITNDMVIHGRRIYFLSEDSSPATVAAVDSATGEKLWESSVISCGFIAADDSQIYCLGSAKRGQLGLFAINQETGQVSWQYSQQKQKSRENTYMPTILPNGQVCWIINSTIHVFSASDGQVLWTRLIEDQGLLSEVKVIENSLYVANAGGLYCFDITSPRQSWHLKYDYGGDSRYVRPILAARHGKICIWLGSNSDNSRLLWIEPADRKIVWAKALKDVSNVCISRDGLYVRSRDVFALDTNTGEMLWSFDAAGCGPITNSEGCVFFVDSSSEGSLIGLDEKTGQKILDLTGMRSCSRFVKTGKTGYLKTNDGVIHVINFKG